MSGRIRLLPRVAVLAIVWACASAQAPMRPTVALGEADEIARGVRHYRVTAVPFLEPPGPVAIHVLRLDPRIVDLTTDLALGDRQGRGPVAAAARRREAIAAVNAGFFNLQNGDPTGPLRIDGLLVSHAPSARGAVAISSRQGRLALRVDRVDLTVAIEVRGRGARGSARVTGVDTTRTRQGLVVYTPRYGTHTGTAPGGTEWILERAAHARRDAPYTVTARADANSAIPRHGVVLSYGGDPAAPPLSTLAAGASVRLVERWIPASGRHADEWRDADDVVNGAGVLIRDGKVAAWSAERLTPSFLARHPRTIVGVDRAGDVWLATIDGRQPGYSVGMTLEETQRFALALGLTEALNLDGGGSTTMVIRGDVVNRPSDPIGPRAVSDVLLVLPRPVPPPRARR